MSKGRIRQIITWPYFENHDSEQQMWRLMIPPHWITNTLPFLKEKSRWGRMIWDKMWTWISPPLILYISVFVLHIDRSPCSNPPLQLADLFVLVILLILHFPKYFQQAVHLSLGLPRILLVTGYFLLQTPDAFSQLCVGLSFQRCILSLTSDKILIRNHWGPISTKRDEGKWN